MERAADKYVTNTERNTTAEEAVGVTTFSDGKAKRKSVCRDTMIPMLPRQVGWAWRAQMFRLAKAMSVITANVEGKRTKMTMRE